MTELELYKFIKNNDIEVKIIHKNNEEDNMIDFEKDEHKDWEVLMFLNLYDLEEFWNMVSPCFFDDSGINVIMKHHYIVVDLLELMNKFGINPKNIFT